MIKKYKTIDEFLLGIEPKLKKIKAISEIGNFLYALARGVAICSYLESLPRIDKKIIIKSGGFTSVLLPSKPYKLKKHHNKIKK